VGQEIAIFTQTLPISDGIPVANFSHNRLWVLKISILPLGFLRMEVLSTNFAFLDANFLRTENLGEAAVPHGLLPPQRHRLNSLAA